MLHLPARYLHGSLAVLMRRAPIWRISSVDSAQEVHLDGVLGDPVLELVEELTAAGQTQAPLIQLDSTRVCEQNKKWSKKRSSLRGGRLPQGAQRDLDTSIFQQEKL